MDAPVFLIGGGRDPDGVIASHQAFVAACDGGPIACIAEEDPDRWVGQLRSAGASDVTVLPLSDGEPEVAGAAGIYVAGGWTPGYQESLSEWTPPPIPYAGYSAGAAIAARRAIVGGWRLGERPVCAEEAGEDLDQLDVREGLGLVPFSVDVHATQWGTLTRLVHAVDAGLADEGVAIDEHTALEVRGDRFRLHGAGVAYRVGRGTLEVLRP